VSDAPQQKNALIEFLREYLLGAGTASEAPKISVTQLTASYLRVSDPDGVSGLTPGVNYNDVVLDSSSDAGLSILAGSTAADFATVALGHAALSSVAGNLWLASTYLGLGTTEDVPVKIYSNNVLVATFDSDASTVLAGKVGIGTTPTKELDVDGDIRALDNLLVSDNAYVGTDGAGSLFSYKCLHVGTYNLDLGTGQRAEFGNLGGQTYSGYNGAYWRVNPASNTNADTVLKAANTNNGRQYDMLGPACTATKIYHYVTTATGAGGTATIKRAVDSLEANTFTGQHLCEPVVEDLLNNRQDYVGLIVCSTGDYKRFDNVKEDWVTGKEGVTINEALPRVGLSNYPKDKAVFGVISNMPNEYVVNPDTGDYERDEDGVAIDFSDIKENQLRINSLGEGALWVCNVSGALENGDYITTCEIPGHGMKQDDDLLHNYTVAKITQDCNFNLSSSAYICEEFEFSGSIYRKAFVGCTYHCG